MNRLLSLILMGVCCSVMSAEGIRKFSFGDLEVIAIQDAANAMPVSIFSGGEIRRNSGTVPASVNVFLIRRGKELILVDAGYGAPRGSLLRKLAELNVRPGDVTAILLTHTHFDHVGGLAEKGKVLFPNAKIYLSVPEYEFARKNTPSGEILKAYGEQLSWFRFDEMVLPGIHARSALGHTPGHTVFETVSLCFIGDLIHGAALQFSDPEVCAKYDMDTKDAVNARRTVLKRAASERKLVLGAHLPFPGIGRVEVVPSGTAGKESFQFLPYEGK